MFADRAAAGQRPDDTLGARHNGASPSDPIAPVAVSAASASAAQKAATVRLRMTGDTAGTLSAGGSRRHPE